MKKRLSIVFIVIFGYLAITFSLFSSVHSVYGETILRKATPIFDGNDGFEPKLNLIECSSFEDIYNPKSYPDSHFRSNKVIYFTEFWGVKRTKGSPSNYIERSINIDLYYFQYPGDAAIYPYLLDERVNVLGAMRVSPWGETADLGEKTMWLGTRTVLFVKGKVLARVDVKSKTLTKDNNYLKKIAQIIYDKL